MCNLTSLNSETKIALVAAMTAIISLYFAYRSYIVSKKALKLSLKQHSENQSDFDLYFNEGFRFNARNGETVKRLLLFHLTIRNKSKFRNTLRADLEIEYLRTDDSVNRMTIEHNPELQNFLKEKSLTVFSIDIELEAKSTSTKWLIFEQPNIIDSTYRIENYRLKLIDIDKKISFVETVLIKDVES